jgi:hypothetical protein
MSTLTRPQRQSRPTGGWRRRIVGLLLIGSVVSAGVAVGVNVSASPGTPGALPAQGAGTTLSGPAVDWTKLMADLDQARDLALRNGNVAAIANYAASDSPAAKADEVVLQQVRATAMRPTPVLPELSDVEALEVSADEARLRVRDRLAAVSWIGPDGVEAATQQARDLRSWLVGLRLIDGRWLLWDVTAEAAGVR